MAEWKVTHIMDSKDCPFYKPPEMIQGCRLDGRCGILDVACTLETCPRRIELSDQAREIIKGIFSQ